MTERWRNVPWTVVEVGCSRYALRRYGPDTAGPVVLLTHFGATPDSWDPSAFDALARDFHLIAIDHRTVGSSSSRDTAAAHQRTPTSNITSTEAERTTS